jgi:hypothetical protein
LRRKEEKKEESAKTAKKSRRANGLNGGAAATDCRNAGNGLPKKRQRIAGKRAAESSEAGTRWYALGPVYVDQVVCSGRKGGGAAGVWVAMLAREGYANGAPATVEKIVEITGLSERTVRHAISALVDIGMLKRDGRKISLS